MTQKVYRLINASILGASSTSKVKVSLNDTTENYLSNKIEAGTGITTAITNPVGNEKLQISADAANIDHNSLQNYDVDEHRLLDDAQTTDTNLWSAEKISTELSTKADLVDGVVPASQLPSYVDDVLEFADFASFPVEGETGKIYVALDSNKTYRWSGSTYIQIASGGVKISSNDTTEGFLEEKVVGESGKIVISTLQEGADEDLQISIGADVFDKTVDTASDISFDNEASALDAENVQAAIDELNSEKVAKSGDSMQGQLTMEAADIVVDYSDGDVVDQVLVRQGDVTVQYSDDASGNSSSAQMFSGSIQLSNVESTNQDTTLTLSTSSDELIFASKTDYSNNISGSLSINITGASFDYVDDGNGDSYEGFFTPDSFGVNKTDGSTGELRRISGDVTSGTIEVYSDTGSGPQAIIPTLDYQLAPKKYVDTSITTLSNELKIPQAIYVNKNPTATGYVATGSIQKPYQTIKEALDSIVDASSSKRYCLIIAPGTYNELNTIRLKGYVDLTSIANDTVIITVAGGSRLLWSNNSPGRVFISNIAISNGVEVLNDNPTGTSGCVLDLDNVDTGTVIFNGRGGGRDFIQLRNDTRLSGSCTINSAATTIFDSTIIGNVNLTDVGCVAPDVYGSAITATLRSNYQLNVNITSTSFDIYVDAWGNNNVSTLTMTSNSAVPSTFNSDALSYPSTITLSGSPAPVVARTTQARSISVNPVNGITSTDVQSALEELQSEIQTVDLSVSSEPTGYLDASQTTISFSDSTPDRTFTISPVADSFVFYSNGERFTKTTAQSIQIPDQEGNHYIYFDVDGVLKSTQVFDESIILTKAFTAIVYWDADNSKHVYFANERHGLVMDGQTHIHFHTVFGAQYISGLALENFTIGDGSSNANAQYTADEGVIRDEDLRIQIPTQTQIPTLYRLGASGNWRRKEVDSYPFIYSGTAGYTGANGRLPFNELTGGSWQLTQIPNNGFVLVHYFATNDVEYPIVAIQGQATYNTIVAARTSANSEISQLSGLPFAEFVPIGSVILQSSNSYTNDVKARVRLTDTGSNYVDFRGSQILVAAATANDHGLLSGLSSDDHIQYHTDSRADTWLGTKDTDDLAQGTNNLYLKINTLDPAGSLNAANDDLVIYSDADSAHRRIKLNQLTSAVGSAGDIAESSTSFLNNVSTPADVSGLAFSAAVVSSFEAQVVVSRGTKKEVFTLLGVQIDGDFTMSVESVGVDTGIDFTISDVGQVKYTSTDEVDGGTIKFRATTLTV